MQEDIVNQVMEMNKTAQDLKIEIETVELESWFIQTDHTKPAQFHRREVYWVVRTKGGHKNEEERESQGALSFIWAVMQPHAHQRR